MEVEGQEVLAGDADEAVREADGEVGEVGAGAEGEDGVAWAFGLPECEERCGYAAADEKAESFGGGPERCDPAEIEAQEDRDGEADGGDAAELVHGSDADEEVSAGVVHV